MKSQENGENGHDTDRRSDAAAQRGGVDGVGADRLAGGAALCRDGTDGLDGRWGSAGLRRRRGVHEFFPFKGDPATGRSSMVHCLLAGRRGVPVGGAGGLPLGGRRPAGRVRADVAVVRPARTALRVAGAAAIGRYNINGFLE